MATIDERLEALTHSVELLAGMHKDTEKQIIKTQKALEKTQKVVAQMAEAMVRLGKIVGSHETRIRRLEK
jgi:methyl-accepting chemotaxis protein